MNALELSVIQSKIYEIRGVKVMLDYDLAEMYETVTKALNQQVKRNIKRFPPDFMFQLTSQELINLRSQIVTSSWGGTRYLPFAFTEHGVTMLAGILQSDKAIEVNIQIVRAFVLLRHCISEVMEVNHKLEKFMTDTNMQFNEIFQVLEELAEQKKELDKPRNPIGFIR